MAFMTLGSSAALPRYVVEKTVLAAISASMRWRSMVKSGSLMVPSLAHLSKALRQLQPGDPPGNRCNDTDTAAPSNAGTPHTQGAFMSLNSRRGFLRGSTSLAAFSFIGTMQALQARNANAATGSTASTGSTGLVASPYGPVAPAL